VGLSGSRVLLRERAVDAVEEMDLPDCDPARLARTYAQFAVVNRVVAGWRSLYRTRLRPRLSPGSTTTLLDIGCGGGDVDVLLSRWAARDGRRLAITAIDPDPRAIRFAQERRRPQASPSARPRLRNWYGKAKATTSCSPTMCSIT